MMSVRRPVISQPRRCRCHESLFAAARDAPAGLAVAIGADGRLPAAAQRRRDGRADGLPFRRRVEHRSGALAAFLPVADIDAGCVQRRRFIDTAGGIADDDVDLVHQADVAELPE
jgi:hypothetical protein